uniref:MADF domain-containing protein n=1 Tax=Clytia hemisphaerica TaxID=252671 RepID=A0A7M5UTQ6_9CNID
MLERNRQYLITAEEVGEMGDASTAASSTERKIDKESIIDAVRPYPPLWQAEHPKFKEKAHKKIIWLKIQSVPSINECKMSYWIKLADKSQHSNSRDLLKQITKLTKTVMKVNDENRELKKYVKEMIKKIDQHLTTDRDRSPYHPAQPSQTTTQIDQENSPIIFGNRITRPQPCIRQTKTIFPVRWGFQSNPFRR